MTWRRAVLSALLAVTVAAAAAATGAGDGDDAAGEGCAVTPEAVEHTLAALRAANVTREPYAHLLVRDVFDPALYACLRKSLPGKKAYDQPFGKGTPRFQLPLRTRLGLGPALAEGAPPLKNKDFWRAFATALGGDAVKAALLDKFAEPLLLRGVDAKAYNRFYYKADLCRDQSAYKIGPHTDAVDKAVSAIFYLPADDSHASAGTAVLRSTVGDVQTGQNEKCGTGICKGLGHKDFEVVRKAPFVPNTLFAFAPCSSAWHAVEQLGKESGWRRDSLQSFVMAKDQKLLGDKGPCLPGR